jgi:hypothetical protein
MEAVEPTFRVKRLGLFVESRRRRPARCPARGAAAAREKMRYEQAAMRIQVTAAALAGIALGLVSFLARAEGMYCGSRLVSKDDSLYQVRSLCGEPDDAQHRVETRTVRERVRIPCSRSENSSGKCETMVERSTDVVIDEWTYDMGRQKFVRLLTFVDGRLRRIETGGYGSKDH